MLSKHDEKLEEIKSLLINWSNDIVKANEKVLDGFKTSMNGKCDEVLNELKDSEVRANMIDNEIITALALFGPEAADLRGLISYLKITSELLRASDQTSSFAKNIRNQLRSELNFEEFSEYIIHLHQCTIYALKYAIEGFDTVKESEAEEILRKVKIEESKTDDMYAILEKNIMSQVCKRVDVSPDYIRALSSIRKLERIADRAVNISKLTMYEKKGGEIGEY